MGIDSFYTSPELAEKLISYIPSIKVNKILDPCLGDGELLRAALKRWPDALISGSDISIEVINKVRGLHPKWDLSVIDLLNNEDISSSKIIKAKKDLILLNPPFTCKGGTIHIADCEDKSYRVSTAMFFVFQALKLLKKDGLLYCILPVSCCFSDKDSEAWLYLQRYRGAKILESPTSRSLFKGCSPSIVLVSISGKEIQSNSDIVLMRDKTIEVKKIIRGNLSVHNLINFKSNEEFSFIHTTNIVDNSLKESNIRCYKKSSKVIGPAILLPRVGRPSRKKIVKIGQGESYIISDCIIALEISDENVNHVYSFIFENWEAIKSTYNGTGAKYTTIERLSKFFKEKVVFNNI